MPIISNNIDTLINKYIDGNKMHSDMLSELVACTSDIRTALFYAYAWTQEYNWKISRYNKLWGGVII
jgi:hypothetical protein